MLKHFRKPLFLIIVLSIAYLAYSQNLSKAEDFNCFSIMAGKNATEDGSVLFAHIEDDFGKQLVNWYIKDAEMHHEGEQIHLKNGGIYHQAHRTNKYFWLEMPGMDFSDTYLNEFGVCIASNSCASKEKDPDLSQGGIGYMLRRIMAERASTAREAVIIGGELVERFGYTGSGRTYCIADPEEAWVMAVVYGKHWVAQRVPDDQIMVLPNNYTIEEVDLTDGANFLACPDLIEYATEKGWYNPLNDGPFNFRKAYAEENSVKHPDNVNRAWGAYHKLNMPFSIDDDFPFSFVPADKVSKKELMDLLKYHYEGTELDKSNNYTLGSPYELNGSMICGKASVYGFVAECRSWMHPDVGTIMWLAPQWPDIQAFIPWYCGIKEIPEGYARKGYLKDLSDHYNPPEDIHESYDGHAFWTFVELSGRVNEDYGGRIKKMSRQKAKLEHKFLKRQPRIEKMVVRMHRKNPEGAREFLTVLTSSYAELGWKIAKSNNK